MVAVGRSTRLLRFVSGVDKCYVGTLALGATTTTLDASGEVVERFDMAAVGPDAVIAAAARFVGELDQVPPMVSAVRVGGRRLYELARAGEEVARAPRRVRVARFQIAPTDQREVFRFEVECSSGTYVRSLAADLGRALGGGAYLTSLRRIAVGPHRLEAAVALEEADRAALISPADLLVHLPRLVLGPEAAEAVSHGRPLEGRAGGDGLVALVDDAGRLLAVYEHRSDALVAQLVHAESRPTTAVSRVTQ